VSTSTQAPARETAARDALEGIWAMGVELGADPGFRSQGREKPARMVPVFDAARRQQQDGGAR
jgi:hypothetical protein